MKISIIDIGSNSVRLMTWADGKVLYKRLLTTRLGEGIAEGVLQISAMERTATAVATFYRQAIAEGANQVFAFATAAVRSAQNGKTFCALVKDACGLTVDVVSGEEEARLGLLGALEGEDAGAIIDIGGASTEVCVQMDGEVVYAVSLDVGAVRMFDACGQDKPLLEAFIEERLSRLDDCPKLPKTYAIGGTATTLGAVNLGLIRYDREKVQRVRLTLAEAERISDELFSLTVAERRALAGMDEKRADIIAGGGLLLVKIMKKLSLFEVYVSDSDNQEGYLYRRIGR